MTHLNWTLQMRTSVDMHVAVAGTCYCNKNSCDRVKIFMG